MIDINKVSAEALQVISRLHKAKFKAYLVGGSVRDLLLNKEPKDFDVVTNATPEQIKKTIKNSRIIGRRFKLVHCIFRNCIIEVATFRCNDDESQTTKSEEGMLLRDNNYGTRLEDDAVRRDYTINSLYYSPYENAIHDFHGGIHDILNESIDIIGDPNTRFHEDPARIIRAYRFAAKLGFKITKRTSDAFPENLELLKLINPNRMFEEVNKLFLTGHGEQSFEILHRKKMLPYILMDQGTLVNDPNFINFIKYSLSCSDERHHQGKSNMPHFLYAVMLWPLVEQLYIRMQSNDRFATLANDVIMNIAARKVLERQNKITAIPMKFTQDILDIWSIQVTLEEEASINNPEKIVWKGLFRASLDFLNMRGNFEPEIKLLYHKWLDLYEFYVPPQMRSRKVVSEKQREEQKAKDGKKVKKFSLKNAHNQKNFKDSKKKDKEKSEKAKHSATKKLRSQKVSVKKAREFLERLKF